MSQGNFRKQPFSGRTPGLSRAHGAPYGQQIGPMTEAEAQEYGPQWGSLITNGDPGYIMYTVIPPEQPEHRDVMVAWLRDVCLPIAKGEYGEPGDVDQIGRMLAYLEALKY